MPNKSNKPIINTNEVSLNNPIQVLTIGGMAIFKACGKIILRVVCQYVSPNASAASIWPFGIACKPPLIASAIYAD